MACTFQVHQIGAERIGVGIAAEGRDLGDPGIVVGQGLGLFVALHLQAVLDAAQELVGAFQRVGGVGLDHAVFDQVADRLDGAAGAQRRFAPAPDQLLVWAKNSISRMPPRPILMSWPLTATLPPPLWAWIWRLIEWMSWIAAKSRLLRQTNGRRCCRNLHTAAMSWRSGGRADHRRPFPVLAQAFVIGFRCQHGKRQRRRAGIGAQPQIDAEHVAVGGALVEDLRQGAGHADGVLPAGPSGSSQSMITKYSEFVRPCVPRNAFTSRLSSYLVYLCIQLHPVIGSTPASLSQT